METSAPSARNLTQPRSGKCAERARRRLGVRVGFCTAGLRLEFFEMNMIY